MPAKDIYHQTVINALIKDGWTITHDPYTLRIGRRDVFIDLGAQKLFAAEKEGRKIAVEIKSFVGKSEIADLQDALGQFIFYQDFLEDIEPERILWLAIRKKVFDKIFSEEAGRKLLQKKRLRLLIFEDSSEEIIQWII